MFAVDRIRSLTLTNRPCQMPLNFDLDAYVKDALVVMRGTPIEVELLFDKPTSAWVKDRQWHPSQQTTEYKDGRLAMSICAADTRDLVGWVLHFGSGVRVVSPTSFRDKVRAEAQKTCEQERLRMSLRCAGTHSWSQECVTMYPGASSFPGG